MKKRIGIVNSTTRITDASVSMMIPRINHAATSSTTTTTAISTQRVVALYAEFEGKDGINTPRIITYVIYYTEESGVRKLRSSTLMHYAEFSCDTSLSAKTRVQPNDWQDRAELGTLGGRRLAARHRFGGSHRVRSDSLRLIASRDLGGTASRLDLLTGSTGRSRRLGSAALQAARSGSSRRPCGCGRAACPPFANPTAC